MTNYTLLIKLIKHFYGISELDEYSLSVINQLGNQLFLGLFSYLALSQVIFWFIITKNPEIGGMSMLGLNTLVLFIIIPTIITMVIRRKGISMAQTVAPEELIATRQKRGRKALIGGLLWTLSMLVFNLIMQFWLNETPLIEGLQNPRTWIATGLGGLFFTTAIVYGSRKNVTVESDNK